jgi:hypothetical protein
MRDRSASRRRYARAGLVAATLASMTACVDLFHSIDFPPLCDDDAGCEGEAGASSGDANEGDAASAQTIDLCAEPATAARAKAEHVCAYLGACLGTTEGGSFGDCMVRALAAFDCTLNPSLRPRGKTAQLWDCLARATSCDAVTSCVFGGPAPRCTGNTSGSYTGCDVDGGSTVVECGEGTVALGMAPCALRGRTCASADPSTSLCTGKNGAPSCTDTSPRCDGTHAVACTKAKGIWLDDGLDCAAYGKGACALDDDGVACAPGDPVETCSRTSKVRCTNEDVAESCVDGHMVWIDCRRLGLSCNATGVSPVDPIRACADVDASVACTTTTDTCISSAVLRGCALGRRFDVDCESVAGLGACSAPDALHATCVTK